MMIRFIRKTMRLAPLWSLLVVMTAACGPTAIVRTKPTAPPDEAVKSVVFRGDRGVNASYMRTYLTTNRYSVLSEFEEDYVVDRPVLARAATKMALKLRRLDNQSIPDVIDRYERAFQSLGSSYERLEGEAASAIGIRREELRQGLGIGVATAAAGLGAVHALKPVGMSGDIFGSGFRAGYDVTRLDNPRMVLGYGGNMRLTLSRSGLGGAYGDAKGRTYYADLDVARQRAAASVSLDDGMALGTDYSHKDETVKSYLKLDF